MGDEKGMKNVMSAERAQELLAAADTAGRWTLARARDAGTYEVRSDPGDRPVTGWGRVVQYRGDAALMAAAPELAEAVVALHARHAERDAAERDYVAAYRGSVRRADRLQEILDGRTDPPSDAEIEAHAAARGTWAITEIDDPRGVVRTRLVLEAQVIAQRQREQPHKALRWIALGADGKPCAWPVVPTEGSAP